MSSGDGGIPLFLRVADGNDSDQAVFADLITDFRSRVDLDVLFVADSALYTAENLATLGSLRWLCRVPRTLGEARRVLEETPPEALVPSASHEGHRVARTTSNYGGVEQRWVVVHSEQLEQAVRERLEKRLSHQERELNARLRRLVGGGRKKTFACQADALEAAEAFGAEHLEGKHYRFVADPPQVIEVPYYGKPGRPTEGTVPKEVRYRLEAELERDEARIEEDLERAGRYLLATNLTSGSAELTDNECVRKDALGGWRL